jgi:protein phosphatase methylesterase 1
MVDIGGGVVLQVHFTGVPAGGPDPTATTSPVLICLHGAGLGSLSFAHFARRVHGDFPLLAVSLRGHGGSESPDDTVRHRVAHPDADTHPELDLSLPTLLTDVTVCVATLLAPRQPVALLGHSLGGALAAFLANHAPFLEAVKLEALGVIDVVEGTALSALQEMRQVLDHRPRGFRSAAQAIAWHIESRTSRNADVARVAVPQYVIPAPASGRLVWRTDLYASEPYWPQWFHGMSQAFCDLKLPRILILASPERLDRLTTIGQMQGKFQVAFVQGAGHAIHEDKPDEFTWAFMAFARRFRFTSSLYGTAFVPGVDRIAIAPSPAAVRRAAASGRSIEEEEDEEESEQFEQAAWSSLVMP